MPWVCFSFASPFLRTSCFLTSARYKSESCCPYDEPYQIIRISKYIFMCSLLALNPATNLSPQRKRMLARALRTRRQGGKYIDHYPFDLVTFLFPIGCRNP